ncbi:tenascin-X-like [Petromyzon marinus]|uniref:tenascin-X-like n=1 Tax=Petromyzon marinus TaxID=7757 RepID=UPI003F6EA8B5
MALLPKTPSPLPAIVLLALVASAWAASLTVETHRHEPGGLGAAPHDLPYRNLTMGGGSDDQQQQPIVFHHVYNINVPPGSLCAVDLDAGPPDGAGSDSRPVVGSGSGDGDIGGGGESDLGTVTQKTHETGSQVVFTHRISIPKRACGCSTEGLPDLRELVRRVELMEQEISSLRQQCSSAACCGAAPGAVGGTDIASPCNGHGTFSTESCGCVCDKGWTGKACSQPACPSDCGGRGTCVDGVCDCEEGFSGPDCGQAACLNDCSNRGVCVSGGCVCERGFAGTDCSQPGCPNDCNGRGRCVDGKCLCARGFSGEDCRESRCPNNCNGRGRCVNGRCVCQRGYGGSDCGEGGACVNDCSDRGKCVGGRCVCEPGFTGPECSVLSCPNDCNGHGDCVNGVCICDKGFVGEDCGTPFIGPKEISFNSITESSVQVGWAALPFPVESWEIIFTSEDTPDRLLSTLSSTETSHTQTGLEPGVKYDVSLVAIKDNKKSQPTTSFFSTLIDSPKDLKVEDVKDTTAQLSWTSPSALVDGLVLTYGPTRPGARKTEVSLQPTVTEHALQGLRPGVHYTVTLHSVRGPQTSDKQIQSFVTGYQTTDLDTKDYLPERPPESVITPTESPVDSLKELQIYDVKPHSMTVSWAIMPDIYNHFVLQYKPYGSTELPSEYSVRGNVTTVALKELRENTEYEISLVASRGRKVYKPVKARVTTEKESKPIAETTTESPVDKELYTTGMWMTRQVSVISILGVPTDSADELHITSITSESMKVSWVVDPKVFERFIVQYKPIDSSEKPLEKTLPGKVSTVDLTDLSDDTEYIIKLIGYRRGKPSKPLVAQVKTEHIARSTPLPTAVIYEAITPTVVELPGTTTHEPSKEVSVSSVSGVPTDSANELVISDITSESMKVSWVVDPKVFERFIVHYKPADSSETPLEKTLPGKVSTIDLTDLTEDTTYTVELIGYRRGKPSKSLVAQVRTGTDFLHGVTAGTTVTAQLLDTTTQLAVQEIFVSSPFGAPTDAADEMRIIDIACDSMRVSWVVDPRVFTRFTVRYNPADLREKPVDKSLPGHASTVELTDLRENTEYVVVLLGLRRGKLSNPLTAKVTTECKQKIITLPPKVLPEELSGTTGLYELPASITQLRPSIVSIESTEGVPVVSANELHITEITPNSVKVSWVVDPHVFDHFIVQYTPTASAEKPLETTLPGQVSMVDLLDLTENTEYTIKLIGYRRKTPSKPLMALVTTDIKVVTLMPDVLIEQIPGTTAVYILPETTKYVPPKEVSVRSEYGAPTDSADELHITEITSDSMKVSWVVHTETFDHFIVQFKPSDSLEKPFDKTIPGQVFTVDLVDLNEDTEYVIILLGSRGGKLSRPLVAQAKTAGGIDDVSTTELIETATRLPAREILVKSQSGVPTDSADELHVTEITSESMKVSWVVDPKVFERFIVQCKPIDSQDKPLEKTLPGHISTVDFTALIDDTEYIIKLIGYRRGKPSKPLVAQVKTGTSSYVLICFLHDLNSPYIWMLAPTLFDEGTGTPTIVETPLPTTRLPPKEVSVTSVSGVPTDSADELVISDITPDSFKVSWVVDPEVFDEFVLEVESPDSTIIPLKETVPGDITSVDLTDLKENTEYVVRLIGSRKGKLSSPLTAKVTTDSKIITVTPTKLYDETSSLPYEVAGTTTQVPTKEVLVTSVSGVPTDSAEELVISDITTNSMKVSWVVDPKVFDRFIVQYKPTDSPEKALEKTLPGHLSTVDLTELTENTEYTVKLIGYRKKKPSKPLVAKVTTESKIVPTIVPTLFVEGTGTPTIVETPLPTTRLPPKKVSVTSVSGVPTDSADELVISDITPDSFKVSWVVDPEVFDEFVLEVESPDSTIIPLKETVPGDITSVDLTDLKENTEYVVRLIGSRKGKLSSPLTAKVTTDSKIITVTPTKLYDETSSLPYEVAGTTTQVPTKEVLVTSVSGVPTDSAEELVISDITTNSMKVSWVVDPKVFDRFIVQYKPTDSPEKALEKTLPGHLSTVDLTELTENTEYTVKLIGYRKKKPSKPLVAKVTTESKIVPTIVPTLFVEGTGTPTIVETPLPTTRLPPKKVSVTSVSGVPTDSADELVISDITPDSFKVSWVVDPEVFDEFVLEVESPDSTIIPLKETVPGDITSVDLTDLKENTEYVVRLIGSRKGKLSSPLTAKVTTDSKIITVTPTKLYDETSSLPYEVAGTTTQVPTKEVLVTSVSGVPTDSAEELVISDITTNSMKVSWVVDPKVFDRFIVQYKPTDSPEKALEKTLPGHLSTVDLTELTENTEYTVKLIGYRKKKPSKPLVAKVTTESKIVPTIVPTLFVEGTGTPTIVETPLPTTRLPPKEVSVTSVSGVPTDSADELVISEITSGSMKVSWVVDPTVFEHFVVQYKPSDSAAKPLEKRLPGKDTKVALTDLIDDTEYIIKIIGFRRGKPSKPLVSQVKTEPEPKSTPLPTAVIYEAITPTVVEFPGTTTHEPSKEVSVTSVSGVPTDSADELVISDITSESMKVSWVVDPKVFERFIVQCKPIDSPEKPLEKTLPGHISTVDFTALIDDTEYMIKLIGYRRGKPSKPLVAQVKTEPKPKSTPSPTAVIDEAITPSVVELPGTATHEPSKDVSVTSVSGVPTDSADELFISDISTHSMKVSWVVDPNVFERFVVQYKPADSSEKPLEKTLPGKVSTIDLTDLSDDTEYIIKLIGYRRGKPSKPLVAQVKTEIKLLTPPEPASVVEGSEPISTFEDLEIATKIPDRTISVTSVSGVPIDSANALVISHITANSIRISWVVDTKVFDRFIVRFKPTGSIVTPFERNLAGHVTTLDIFELTENTEYTIILLGARRGLFSKPLMAKVTTETKVKSTADTSTYLAVPTTEVPRHVQQITVTATPGVPFQSANELTISEISDDSIVVSWKSDPKLFDKFIIRYRPTCSSKKPLDRIVSSHDSMVKIKGLLESTVYEISILGIKRGRFSKPVSAKIITALSKDKGMKLATTAIPTETDFPVHTTSFPDTEVVSVFAISGVPVDSANQLYISEIKPHSIRVSWVVHEYVFDKFVVKYKPVDSADRPLEQIVPGDVKTIVLKHLKESTEYEVTIVAKKRRKYSKPLTARVISGIDGPKNLQVVSVTESTMDIEWEDTQSPIDHYTVHYSTSSGDPPGNIKVYKSAQPTTKITITGLQPGTEYKISVVAVKGSKGSAPASTTGQTDIDGPKDLQVTDSSDTNISLSWTAPSTSFDRYTITFASDTSDDGREVTVPADATTATLSDLEPGTEYTISLRAEKGSVHSARALTSGKTGCKPATAMRFSDITPTSLVASWASPPATPDYYIVKYSQRNREPHTVAVSGGQNYVVLSDLKPDTEYRVRVISVKGVSSSKPLIGDVFTASGSLQPPCPDANADDEDLNSRETGEPDYVEIQPASNDAQKCKFTENAESASTAPPPADKELYGLSPVDVESSTMRLSWASKPFAFQNFVIKYGPVSAGKMRKVVVAGDSRSLKISGLKGNTEYVVSLAGVRDDTLSPPLTIRVTTATASERVRRSLGLRRADSVHKKSLAATLKDEGEILSQLTDVSASIPHRKRGSDNHVSGDTAGLEVKLVKSASVIDRKAPEVISENGYFSEIYSFLSGLTTDFSSAAKGKAIDTPRDIDFKDTRETSVVVAWTAPSADADSFKIAYVPTAGGEPESRRVASSLTEVTLTHLTPGTEYEVNLISVKGFQESDPLTGTFTTLLDSPSVLSAEDVTDSSALLKWKPTIGPVDTYTLTYSFEDEEPVTVTVSGGTVEHQLTDLNPNTPYVAKVRAVKGAQQSADTAVDFITARKKTSFPRDCSEALQGDQASGVFTIFLNGNASQPLPVYCDMTTDGGGWIVVQRRQNGLTDFFRNWKAYEKGFGDINDEFWLGLQNIFALTSQGRYELRVDLRDGEWGAHAVYDHFSVANASGLYRLKVGEYSGTAGDSMTYHQGRPFSTVDRDNDLAITNCAVSYHGAWWYKNCHRANLNGKYGDTSHSQGVNWYHWKGHEYSVPFVEMKIRPFAAAKRGSRQHLRQLGREGRN